jgi:hypothetical protein
VTHHEAGQSSAALPVARAGVLGLELAPGNRIALDRVTRSEPGCRSDLNILLDSGESQP